MARDAIAITALASGAATANAAGTAINTANGATIAAAGDTNRLIVEIENSAAAEKEVTIKAGANPPAVRKGVGDLVLKIAEKTTVKVVLESARHKQADGSISIDYSAGTTGKAWAYRIPRAV